MLALQTLVAAVIGSRVSIAVIWGGRKIFAAPTSSANGCTILSMMRAMGGRNSPK